MSRTAPEDSQRATQRPSEAGSARTSRNLHNPVIMRQRGQLQHGLAPLKGFADVYSLKFLVSSLIVVALCIVIRHVLFISITL
jgi:hypothetical protein